MYSIFDYLGNVNKRIKILFSLKYSFDCFIFKIIKYLIFYYSIAKKKKKNFRHIVRNLGINFTFLKKFLVNKKIALCIIYYNLHIYKFSLKLEFLNFENFYFKIVYTNFHLLLYFKYYLIPIIYFSRYSEQNKISCLKQDNKKIKR